jgi:large subunit ribosomal protein L25
MPEVLNVKVRQEVGRNAVKRVRKAGQVPAILYGHGQENVNLAIPGDELGAALRHKARLVGLEGDVKDTALIREIQWDAIGVEPLHVDLVRVSATEAVQVHVPLELRGQAAGAKEGGVVKQLLHEIEIECPAGSIPERIEVSINALQVDQMIKVADVALPAGVQLLSDPTAVVVQCAMPVEIPEEEPVAAAPAEGGEPEIIGRKPAEEEEEGEGG